MKQNTTTPAETTTKKWVAYYRVSTKKQDLGIDAQRARVQAAALSEGAVILAEFSEKESGKDDNRAALHKAMATARREGAVVVVAKHDRISRHISFAAKVIFDSCVSFRILNLPETALENRIVFGVFFGMADEEARMISERTRAALAVLKAKGVKLGRPDAAESITPAMIEAASKGRHDAALNNPNNIKSAQALRLYLNNGGKRSLSDMAKYLSDTDNYTSRGSFHTAASVKRLCTLFCI